MYIETMKGLFEKIPAQLPKPQILREKRQSLLHDIGGEWYMKKINEKLSPLKKKKAKNKNKKRMK